MKLGVAVLTLVFTVMSINYAVAGGRYGHHYNSRSPGYGHHDNNHYQDYGYNSYGYRRYDRHYDHSGNYAAYALGGLIVGGILAAILTSSYKNGTQQSNYKKLDYGASNPVNNTVQPSYIMQADGACYVISHVNNGNLVLSPVSSGNCQ